MALTNLLGDISLEATQKNVLLELKRDVGAWAYLAGISGNVAVVAGAKVRQIAVTSPLETASQFTINGGQTIIVPAGQSLTIEPKGNLIAPSITFTGTSAYFIEYVI